MRIPASGVKAVRTVLSSWARPSASWSAPSVSLVRSSFAGVALGDGAGHFVADLAVLPGQFCLVEALSGGAGDSGKPLVTPGIWETREAISSRSASPLPVRMSVGFSTTRNSLMTTSLREVAVQQVVAQVAGRGVWLALAVVVADFDGCCRCRQGEQDDQADDGSGTGRRTTATATLFQ